MTIQQRLEGRSLFWPLVLIGVGLVWLLGNMGILQPANMGMLFRLWPFVLIIIGLDLLFGRRSPRLGTLIGVGGVLLIVGLMLVGPSLGWVRGAEAHSGSYSELVGDASSAQVNLDLSVAQTTVHSLQDSGNLFEADVRYVGEVVYNVSGESEKTITLSQKDEPIQGINFWDWGFFDENDLRWDVGLSNDVPVELNVSSGLSNSTLDLEDIQLTGLRVDTGAGSVDLSLPAMPEAYTVSLDAGAGSMDIRVEEDAAITFDINGGVGGVTVDVPDGAAVRVDASTGVGGIDVPSSFQQVSGAEDNFVSDEGVWETEGFEDAERQIIIEYDGGVGSFTVK